MSLKPANKRTPPAVVYQLRIELLRLEPLIWRRILVPGALKLVKLDRVLQAAMGWNNTHLHEWVIQGQRYGMPDEAWGEQGMRNDRKITVSSALHDSVDSFTHNYDFGDGWEHQVTVEKRLAVQEGRNDWPMCIAGENACPPDDVGGPDGYLEFLQAVRDPQHEQHLDYWRWWGGPFDPAGFSVTGDPTGPLNFDVVMVGLPDAYKAPPNRPLDGDVKPGAARRMA